MKKILFILFALSCSMMEMNAQAFAPNTGDNEMNGILKDINSKAIGNLEGFAKDVAGKFKVAKAKIDQAVKIMAPGDVFMSAQVASILKKPFEEVTKAFQVNKHKGWGVIAKDLGIKPGSPAFHEMKKAMKSHGSSGHGNSNGNGNGKGNSGKGNGNGKKK